jgi:hypothetical protein
VCSGRNDGGWYGIADFARSIFFIHAICKKHFLLNNAIYKKHLCTFVIRIIVQTSVMEKLVLTLPGAAENHIRKY